jgi:F-type H+-transporting ATPase subunit epsilon
MNAFLLTVSSPDGTLFSQKVLSFSARGTGGDLAVLAGHIPFVTYITSCDCKIELEDGTERSAHTEGGLLTVGKEKTVFLSGSFCWNE